MSDIKLTRWATYLLPGSLVVSSMSMLFEKFSQESVAELLVFPHSTTYGIFAFLGLSYVVGMGLWGVAYHPCAQRLLLFKSHTKRLEDMKKICNSPWYEKQNLPDWQQLFPELSTPNSKEKDAYHDFEFTVVKAYLTKSPELRDRIIRDRETVGLIQALILGLWVLFASLVVLTACELGQNRSETWRSAISLACVALVTVVAILMLYVHYCRRQHYLVRDVLMTFLSDKEQQK